MSNATNENFNDTGKMGFPFDDYGVLSVCLLKIY